MAATASTSRPTPPDLVWNWSAAARGVVYVAPAAIVAASDPARGFALAIGVLPAALMGLAPKRRGRLVIGLSGPLIGIPIFLGTVLAGAPVLAVVAIFFAGVASVWLAQRARLGVIAMTLALPMIAVGLSYDDIGKGAGIAALMTAGAVYACLISMLWPERPATARAPAAAAPPIDYGVRLGAAGALCAAIGFAAGLDHVGWATAACLLVMRPVAEMQRLRSSGRILAVALGAFLAVGVIKLDPADGWYAIAVLIVLAGASGSRGSRFYIVPAFTTFLVFLLLLYAAPEDAAYRFGERIGETLLGVAIAYFFGLAVPAFTGRSANSVSSPS